MCFVQSFEQFNFFNGCSCGFFFCLFFPCLFSAVADLIVYHMMGDHLRAGKPPQFVTGQNVAVLSGLEAKAGMAHSTCG